MPNLEWLFVVAFVLYSVVIWWHKFSHSQKLSLWMVLLFGIGLAADITGTIFLCVVASARWTWTIHTISGLVALLIMAAHFLWAVIAIKMSGKSELFFNRFSVYAWSFWLIPFISGIPRQ
jgi:uncharacterized repeat protein (TIGR03987 family)